tara:strand:- start:189 stop:848 length:660 start_codon:yes stop_codon:yes gene_type:complete
VKTKHIELPLSDESFEGLELGTAVYLQGTIYTGREGLYKRVLDQGIEPPVPFQSLGNANFHCSPAASVNEDGSYNLGAVTATASFRFARWLSRWFEISGCRVIIGKGGMTEEDYRKHFVPNGAIYLSTVGYGTGALLGRGIKQVKDVYWLKEMGIAQAMWVLDVENFGPFIVESDMDGNSLFEREGRIINQNVDSLYDGLRQPALKRYGETTSRSDEVV